MRIKSLDALRGGAALAVAIPHYLLSQKAEASWTLEAISIVSVEVFFILSGFVLAPQILFCMERDHWPRLRVFLVRRWMRTIPPYVLALFLAALLASQLFTPVFFKYLFFVQNIASIDAETDFFPIAWSLSIEEWFYVVFPFFLLLTTKLKVRLVYAVTLFIFFFAALKVAGALTSSDWGDTSRRLVLFRLDAICLGFVLYLATRRLQREHLRAAGILATIALACSAVVLQHTLTTIGERSSNLQVLLYLYAASFFSISLLLLFYCIDAAFQRRVILGKAAEFFGAISYDIYLFHLVVLLAMDGWAPGITGLGRAGIYLAAVLLISCLVRWTVEIPILNARPGYKIDPGERRS